MFSLDNRDYPDTRWSKINDSDTGWDRMEVDMSTYTYISQSSVFGPFGVTGSLPWSDTGFQFRGDCESCLFLGLWLTCCSRLTLNISSTHDSFMVNGAEVCSGSGCAPNWDAMLSRHLMAVSLQSSPVVSWRLIGLWKVAS